MAAQYFIGTLKKGKVSSARLLKEDEVIFAAENVGDRKVAVVFQGHNFETHKGEEFLIADKESTIPTPKFEIFKDRGNKGKFE